MKYSGTYFCGHDGTIDIWGPSKDRKWRIEKAFSGLCPECYEKKLKKDREKDLSEARQRAEQRGFPEILG